MTWANADQVERASDDAARAFRAENPIKPRGKRPARRRH